MQPLKPEFLEQLDALLGADSKTLAAALDTEPQVAVRLNPHKTVGEPAQAWSRMAAESPQPDAESLPASDEDDSAGACPVAWCRHALHLERRPKFTLMPELHAGAIYVQDASSTVVATIVGRIAQQPMRVLDLCAAPGGKTTAALSSLPQGSLIVANEVMPPRAKILHENLTKWGAPDLIISSAKAECFGKLGPQFDLIIADVPCSGEGMMRKDEDARAQWSAALTRQCARLQREILAAALPALRPGGYLLYSTCTFNSLENEENVRWLMEEFALEPVDTGLEGVGGISPALAPEVKGLRFMPHLTRGEGLFVAMLRKPEEAEATRRLTARAPRPVKSEAARWIVPGLDIYQHDDRLQAMSPSVAEMAAILRQVKGLRLLSAGVDLAQVKGRDLIPAQALALSEALRSDAFIRADVSRATALAYLRRETIALPPDTPRGYVLICFDGHPLGFVKNLGNRCNSLYPKEWRIRI